MNETDVGLSAMPDGWVWTTLEKVSQLLNMVGPRVGKIEERCIYYEPQTSLPDT